MLHRLQRGYIALILMMATVCLFLVAMASPVISTTTDFSIYNSGWNGTSGIAISTYELGNFVPTLSTQASGTDMRIAHLGLQEFDLVPTTDSLMILGPTKGFSMSDGEIVRSFVMAGGIVLLADDFGTGNSLLDAVGAQSRFTGKLLMDLSFDRSPEFPVCFDFAADPLTDGLSTILLNHPSSISVSGSNTSVIARSSIGSWLDSDGDYVRDLGEPRGPFPVMVRERIGAGTLILLSDPSALINGMVGQLDNELLSANIVSVVCDHRLSVYFDESHREYFDPVSVTTEITGDLPFATKMHLLVIAALLLLWVSTDVIDETVRRIVALLRSLADKLMRLIGKRIPEEETSAGRSPEELLSEVIAKHPDWKPGLIRYALTEGDRHGRYVSKALENRPSIHDSGSSGLTD